MPAVKLVVGIRAFCAPVHARCSLVAVAALILGALVPSVVVAGGRQARPARATQRPAPRQFNLPGAPDPPAPVAPEVIVRGDNGRVVVRATKLPAPLTVDGVLDEPVYAEVKSISDFIQTVPNEGEPATERTEAWITYDENNFYLSCRCWDSASADDWTANELRRDTSQLRQNDMFGAARHLPRSPERSTYPARRARRPGGDQRGQPERRLEPGVVRAHRPLRRWMDRGDGHPFKSIRYVSGDDQQWSPDPRSIRRKNEWTHHLRAGGDRWRHQHLHFRRPPLVGLDLPTASRTWS
jgi:hypothetical protein